MRPVGLQDYNTNTNKRDTLQSNLRKESSHPNRSRTHQPQEGVLRRATETKSGLLGRSQKPSLPENDQVPIEDGRILQSEGKAEKVQHWRSRPLKGDSRNKGLSTRQARTNLGRTLQGCPLFLPSKLPLGGSRRKQATSFVECRASKEVLRKGAIA